MVATDLQSAIHLVETLFNAYQDDHRESLLSVVNGLGVAIDNDISKQTQQREKQRTIEQRLSAVAEHFTETSAVRYYFVPGANRFVMCDGASYSGVREDDVIAGVLRMLQTDAVLCKSKQKSRHAVMKLIKSNLLSECIPDSEAIKATVDLFRAVLSPSKNDAKHLLTCIGDIILKKQSSAKYIVAESAINHLCTLSDLLSACIGWRVPSSVFISSYTQEQASTCRMVRTRDGVINSLSTLRGHEFTIYAVACHYSHQYGDSDAYVGQSSVLDPLLATSYFSPRDVTLETAVSQFIADNLASGNKCSTPFEHVLAAWNVWRTATSFFMAFQTDKLRAMLPPPSEDGLHNLALKDGIYIKSAFAFCETMIEYDHNETLLELSELFALFIENTQLEAHNENIFQVVVKQYIANTSAAVDEGYIHGARVKCWDKHSEVISFLAAIDVSTCSNILALYRAYARATPGRKVSRAYFAHKASESGKL